MVTSPSPVKDCKIRFAYIAFKHRDVCANLNVTRALVFEVSSEGPLDLVTLCDEQGVPRTFCLIGSIPME